MEYNCKCTIARRKMLLVCLILITDRLVYQSILFNIKWQPTIVVVHVIVVARWRKIKPAQIIIPDILIQQINS